MHQTTVSLILATLQSVCMIPLFGYCLIVFFTLSQLLNDLAMFTYIGAVITPTMALEYITLLAAVSTTVVTMVMEVQKGYSDILTSLTNILNSDKGFRALEADIRLQPNFKITLLKDDNGVHILKKNSPIVHSHLLTNESFTMNISKELYIAVIDEYQPVRRQIALIVIKVLLTIYFIGIAMWIKNVFHIESKVSNIFTVASKVAIFFFPAMLEFLAYKGQFGKKSEGDIKKELFVVVCNYLEVLSQNI